MYLYESDVKFCFRKINLVIINRLEWKEYILNMEISQDY